MRHGSSYWLTTFVNLAFPEWDVDQGSLGVLADWWEDRGDVRCEHLRALLEVVEKHSRNGLATISAPKIEHRSWNGTTVQVSGTRELTAFCEVEIGEFERFWNASEGLGAFRLVRWNYQMDMDSHDCDWVEVEMVPAYVPSNLTRS